jgi:ADP-heptose:LPS heptosyltransferase
MLVFELRQLGDAANSVPFIRGAMEVFDVFICCQPGVAALYEMVVEPARIIRWSAPWGRQTGKYNLFNWDWSGLFRMLAEIRRLKVDAAVSVWADARDHLLLALSGAAKRFGFPMNETNYYAHERAWRKRQLRIGRILSAVLSVFCFRRLLNRPLNRNSYLQNHLEDWKQLAGALEIPWRTETPWFSPGTAGLRPELKAFKATAAETGRPAWLIHPGARTPNRRWPAEKFEQVIQRVFLPQGIPYIVIQPAECEAPPVSGPLGCAMKTETLHELLQAINAVDYVLCNDTGVSHLAAALGKRVVSLFSATSRDWFAPFNNREFVVENDVCPYRPCLDRCEMPSFICLEAISVDAVVARVEEVTKLATQKIK